jgi:kynurenine formamidase
VWPHDEKEQVLYEYFLNTLGSAEPRQSVINWNELQMPQLVSHHIDTPFSEVEDKNAIAELPTEKAPGPYSFMGVFFKMCWDIIKP